ncbi:branched-chain amino acid ABC transporter substrate-binding protein [Deinococcus arenae]|uniref:Branched-chain amino acid ABC transporter substrate-binding protein n=1 Tax=Deinococcus arenae TaxID=1452751 RepID=A0A8H9GQR1_9DEIO|nr:MULTISPECIES: ABC transporter substrate-binding protein [Deinococcus]AWT35097.1 branched-chain amino acid ABC transporter substrate-binding protein [Deinococcus actinosclerus]GGM44112.1 branched-chain amino acid ABC transporter substrate-binding protein [Deinococcus arenae]
MKKALFLSVLALSSLAAAEIRVGVIVSATGPAASLGIPEKNTVALLPQTIAGQPVVYTVLDDASDTTAAVTNARKLIQEGKVDLIIGTTTTPASLAMIDVVAEAKVPMISLAASEGIIKPVDAKRAWVFKTPQTDALMAAAIVQHMVQNKVRTIGYIGFNDAYGEGWASELKKNAAARGLKVVAEERYGRSDTSVTGQILKLVAARPDAILIGASGVPAVLPQKALKDRGYAGKIYQTHGVANADFLRVGGRDVEGAILPAGPVLVADQLPGTNPTRKVGLAYMNLYEAKYGKDTVSTFGAHMWDAGLLMQKAVPAALKKAKPGTPAFREALRDALEGTRNVIGAHGIFNLSATDHLGLDARSRVMVQVVDGTWKLLPTR